jgi:Tfx family DNA-binding protein
MVEDTFLTKMQARVLELRVKGLTQAEIARQLKTSRANVCILEHRARRNIARAERTLKLSAKILAPVVLKIKPGDDVISAPRRLFSAADAAKVDVKLDTPALIAKIRREAQDKLRGRTATAPIELVLTADGEVFVY